MFGRIDYDDLANRKNTSEMQTIWRSSSSLGSVADIFTEVLYRVYYPPPGFCFDTKCADPPIMVSCCKLAGSKIMESPLFRTTLIFMIIM